MLLLGHPEIVAARRVHEHSRYAAAVDPKARRWIVPLALVVFVALVVVAALW